MYGNLMKKAMGSALSPIQGVQKMIGGDIQGGLGDMTFGPDIFYGNYWRKKTGLQTPQQQIDYGMPELSQQVGYGDYTGDMGASNPYGALRGRGSNGIF